MDASESRPYFLSHKQAVRVGFDEDTVDVAVSMLREAQAGAYWAVRSHFTARSDPALVVMPTGSGKTAVMTLLAFGITRKRLLIVAPARVIREQIAREFQTLSVARRTGCLPESVDAPKVCVVSRQLSTEESWRQLEAFDVVVATAKCVSPGEKNVYETPPINIFDTIFFDEAHHLPASTWDKLVKHFHKAHVVTFTATPYRNDKKPIPGEIVYSYPLARAIAKGIYRKIEFIPVEGYGTKEERDHRLAQRAIEILKVESEMHRAKLLVRVGRLSETKAIKSVYKREGLDLEVVSSKKSLAANQAAIEKVMKDKCHGLISVGMLGEGLDLPVLRVAVMHRPHQSFPITLQFIGRICRVSDQREGAAKLIAIPDEIQEHTQGLYELDANWAELIPDLADAAVGQEQARRRFARQRWEVTTSAREVSIHTLRPSFSVAVYEVLSDKVSITRDPQFGESVSLRQSFVSDDKKWRVLITKTIVKPTWTTSDSLLDIVHDLLIYYRVGDLLFEYTTSLEIAAQVRHAFVNCLGLAPRQRHDCTKSALRPVQKDRIEQAISQGDVLAYFNVGMRRVTYASSAIPSYKMMTGSHTEDTIREEDGHFFSVGHVFGRVQWNGDQQVIGVSGDSAKIWSAARDHIKEFTAWCDQLASKLTNDLSVPLPYLSHLKTPVRADYLPAQPYAAEFNNAFFDHLQDGLRLEVKDENGVTCPIDSNSLFELSVVMGSWNSAVPHRCNLKLCAGAIQLQMQYDLEAVESYSYVPVSPYLDCLVKVPESRGRLIDYTFAEYFSQFPPTLYLIDGSAVTGKYLYLYQPPAYNLPDKLLEGKNWDTLRCDITVEDHTLVRDHQAWIASGKQSVLQATADLLLTMFSEDCVIFTDHHAGEIADYVALEPQLGGLRIHLFHCKASGKKEPGVRLHDAYEVLGQVRKCVRWLRKRDLFKIVQERLRAESMVRGSIEDFLRLVARCSPNTALYSVHAVQPGFNIPEIKDWRHGSMRLMFVSSYDELRNQGVDFHIIGSEQA